MGSIFNESMVWPSCDLCNNTGWKRNEFDEIVQKNGKDQHCKRCYLQNKFLNANIGFDYWTITSENWKGSQNDLIQIVKYFKNIDQLKEEGRGFYIYGEYGVGKTSLANMFLRQVLLTTNHSCLFVPFSELVVLNSKIMNGWHDKNIERAITDIKDVDFLVLDDLAKEYDNERDNGRATLNTILRYRDSWRKPTIYTSNIPIEETLARYGGSNYSIIQGRSTIVNMEQNADFRLKRKMIQELNDEKEST